MRPYTDNVTPASPAMTRAVLALHRAFSNRWGRQKAKARYMMGLGPRHDDARARYSKIASSMARQGFGLDAAILHLRFARRFNPNKFERAVFLECLFVLRWLRRHNPYAYYPIRDALTTTSAIVPRSW